MSHPFPNGFPSYAGPLSRREVLRAGSLGLLGLGLPGLLQGQALAAPATGPAHGPKFGKAKACILLFMWGGPAHQDTWDMKPDAPAEIRGQFKPIATRTPGVQICEHFPQLAQRMDKLCLVRSMTHTNTDHTLSTSYLLTGQPPKPGPDRRGDWPHMGAVLSRIGRGREPLPPFVSMRPKTDLDVPRFVEESHGQSAGWLGQMYDPLTIDHDPNKPDYTVGDFALPADMPSERLEQRRQLLSRMEAKGAEGRAQGSARGPLSSSSLGLHPAPRTLHPSPATVMSRHYQRAFDLLNSTAAKSAFDVKDEPLKVRERYGLNAHGQSVLQARRLVERGVPLVTVFWPNDGIKNVSVYWDTHSRNFIDLKDRLMPPSDQAFSALLDDLSERGMLDETLVLWTGEFGRTPKVGQRNSDAGAGADGRDHWPGCFTSVLAGAGIRGGSVYGSSDKSAAYPASQPTAPVDLVATAYHLLGVPPHLALPDPGGRPQVICPGEVVHGLVG